MSRRSLRDHQRFKRSLIIPTRPHPRSHTSLELSEDDWRDLMQACGYTVPEKKARRASAKPDTAPLINPSREQAEQLQAIWNLRMVAACKGKRSTAKPNEVYATTQATYSANSKGDYDPFKTVEIAADGRRVRMEWKGHERVRSGEPVARIRISAIGGELYKPDAVVIITDKPTKPLPIDLDTLEEGARQAANEEAAA